MVNTLVARYGRTGFAALSSVIWALPMAAWAGSSDLSPIDKTAYPWIALSIGLVMLVVWLVLAVLGLVIKGLFWLFIIGLILFVATGIFGWVRRRT